MRVLVLSQWVEMKNLAKDHPFMPLSTSSRFGTLIHVSLLMSNGCRSGPPLAGSTFCRRPQIGQPRHIHGCSEQREREGGARGGHGGSPECLAGPVIGQLTIDQSAKGELGIDRASVMVRSP